ncbi:MAG: hypothetical protein C5B51_19340 [Terriglobia bacterium]|nr:MAG: hypothetical protein C5B51_19340 [Terriglobia bacterium]
MNRLAKLSITALLLSIAARAQAVGTISGTVTDSSGAVVPGATIAITNQDTGQERTATTDSVGQYAVTLLPIGAYTVAVTAKGFTRTESKNIALEVQQKRTIDLVLQPEAVGTQINVSSEVPQVEVQRADATLGQIIHTEQVSQLPLNGRNFVQLAFLGTGTVQGREGGFLNKGASSEVSYRGSMSLSAQGMRENANDWLLDGIDNNELTAGGVAVLPSIDAINEFRVLTFNYSAQYGSRGGTTVLVSSRSGTNSFHGSLFEFLRNDHLDARNFFDGSKKGQYNQNEFGGSIGGPIIRNRTFFFGDFQVNKIRQGLTILSTVPTLLQRQGIFTESFPGAAAATVYDPTSLHVDPATGNQVRDPFPNNRIPTAKITPIGQAIANIYPAPLYTDRLAGNYLSNPVRTIDDYLWDLRLDHSLSDNDRFFGRFSRENAAQFSPSGLPGFGAQTAFASTQWFTTHARNAAASETHIFSPTVINQFTAGYNRVFNYIQSIGYGSNAARALGIPGANLGSSETSQMTNVSVTGFNPIGDRQYSPFQGGTNVYQFTDAVDITRGGHSIHTGFTFRAMQENTLGDNCFAGCFAFNNLFTAAVNPNGTLNGATGSSIASLLVGFPTTGSRNDELNGSVRGRRWKEYRGFVQDDWRVRQNLTLNLGLAYDVTTPLSEAHDRFSNFIIGTGKYLIAGQNADSNIGVKTDHSGIEPRFGFAWTPIAQRNFVVRGGYGIFHDVGAQGGTQGPYQNPPYANAYAFISDNLTPVRTLSTGFPDNSQPTNPGVYTGDWKAIDPNYKMGRIQQWNLNLEQSLGGGTVLTVAYAGTHGTRLMEKNFNFNSAPPGPYNNPRALRPYPQYNNILVTDSHGWLKYNSLQVRVERRTAKGLYLLAAYTYSSAMTNGLLQEITGDPGVDYYPLNAWPNADKGHAATDLRNSLTISSVYQLPIGKGHPILPNLHGIGDAILGGWQLNGILVARSGFPLGMTVASNQSGTALTNRPNRICDGKLSSPTVNKWFDTSCFVAPAPGFLGNSARSVLYGPDQVNLDFSTYKNFRVREGHNLQFRAEFFNLPNHSEFLPPAVQLGAATFGRVLSTVHSSRQIQFALKYVF